MKLDLDEGEVESLATLNLAEVSVKASEVMEEINKGNKPVKELCSLIRQARRTNHLVKKLKEAEGPESGEVTIESETTEE